MDRHKLDGLTREELVALASELGIVRPRSLTVPELIDEIISRTASSEREKARSRGWLGRARSLLASVIERGLHLPDVAKALRNAPSSKPWPVAPPPLATMTLAEIYAAQGHLDKALHVLDEILAREPEHADARSLRQRLDTQNTAKKRPEAPSKRDDVSAPIEAKTTVETKEAVANEPAPPVAFAEAPEAVEAPSPAAESAPATVEPEAAAAPSSAAPDTDKMPPVQSAPEEPSAAREVDQQEAPVEEPAEKIEASPEEEPAAARSFEDQTSDHVDSYERPSIEELPLPERYNVDEIVGIAVEPTTVYLYWEVRPIVLARAHARRSEGTMVVRIVAVTPSWDGPIVEQRDLPIDALYGDAYVRSVRPGSNVRIAVGWLEHGDFAPFAIGDPVAMPRKEPAFAVASTVVRWTPEGMPLMVPPGQTLEVPVIPGFDLTSLVKEAQLPPVPPSMEREQLGERWPTFDLGQRGLPANEQDRAPRSMLGGASELVRPGEQRQR